MSAISATMNNESGAIASMIDEHKCFHEYVEDELSTSAESSDNEVIASGDDEQSSRSASGSDVDVPGTPPPVSIGATKKRLVAEIARLPMLTLLDLCAFLSTLSNGTQSPCCASEQRQQLQPPPGLETQQVQSIQPPPGLETLSRPPGLLLQSATKPARRSKARQFVSDEALSASSTDSSKDIMDLVVSEYLSSEPPAPVLIVAPATPVSIVAPMPPPALEPREFDQAIYRKELSDVLRDLANGSNVASSVRRIRAQSVPQDKQAAEFSDILTRAAEEHRGAARRLAFAFAAGLANGAFEHEECLAGLNYFFLEVFEDLATEVPRLRNKIANEMLPTMRAVFSVDEMSSCVPPDCRSVLC